MASTIFDHPADAGRRLSVADVRFSDPSPRAGSARPSARTRREGAGLDRDFDPQCRAGAVRSTASIVRRVVVDPASASASAMTAAGPDPS